MIRQRQFLVRNRRRIALLAAVGAIALAVAFEHSGMGHGELMDEDMGQAVSMCLAVIDVAAFLLIGGAALLGVARRRWFVARELGSKSLLRSFAPVAVPPRVRAGPQVLQVFLS